MTDHHTENDAMSRKLGKWGTKGFPTKGWTCDHVEELDRGETRECEACEQAQVHFVHYMSHSDWPNYLLVGCVCAGHLEEDYSAPRRREQAVRNLAKRRQNFPTLKAWRMSRNGNQWIDRDGYRVVVFEKGGVWRGLVENTRTGRKVFAQRTYDSERAVKLGAFDAIRYMEARG